MPTPPEGSGSSTGENVVYLTEEHGIQPGPPRGVVPPNRHANQYEGVTPVPDQQQPEPAGPTAVPPLTPPLAPQALPIPHSHGELPAAAELVPPPQVDDNPYGNFFADGPSAWLEDEDDEEHVPIDTPRVLGTLLAAGAIVSAIAAWAVWGVAMYRGFAGAEAGAFILASMLLWLWYLTLPRAKQHAFMLRRHVGMQRLIERRTSPLRERTEGSLSIRRERNRYRAMRDERTRRVNALGESAYREFRQGRLAGELEQGAQRVLGIERQMLVQDHRIHSLQLERQRARGHDGDETAAMPPAEGQPPR
ncbi:MAG: hypothetical protein ABI200_01540 [Gaiellales bacterium]